MGYCRDMEQSCGITACVNREDDTNYIAEFCPLMWKKVSDRAIELIKESTDYAERLNLQRISEIKTSDDYIRLTDEVAEESIEHNDSWILSAFHNVIDRLMEDIWEGKPYQRSAEQVQEELEKMAEERGITRQC